MCRVIQWQLSKGKRSCRNNLRQLSCYWSSVSCLCVSVTFLKQFSRNDFCNCCFSVYLADLFSMINFFCVYSDYEYYEVWDSLLLNIMHWKWRFLQFAGGNFNIMKHLQHVEVWPSSLKKVTISDYKTLLPERVGCMH